MGVIKKILYRGNILGKPRHRNLFLDMEENIHIHYRDLRIELSRGEFEDIVAAFTKQSAELLGIIEEKHYQDGQLPNANQDDVRIWTESRLKHEVKYHPTRFSLEECGDGYHFHYRNYKFLIDPPEFKELVRLFRSLDVDGPYAASYDEVLALLEANEVDFRLDAGDAPGEKLAIRVAGHHLPKIRDIFNYIGFAREGAGELRRYRGERLVVEARPDSGLDALDYRRRRGLNQVGLLVDYLARRQGRIDVNEINRIKVQVLELYFALDGGERLNVETDPELWLYAPANRQVIFPFSPVARGGRAEADRLYRSWSNRLKGFDMGFVKPVKEPFPAAVQETLQRQVEEALRREVAAYGAVERIHVMGSGIRGDMGRYQAPFIHGKLAKLGSDVDILVEIDPAREGEIPGHWKLHLPEASNHCSVYHVGEVPLAGEAGDWAECHPHVPFIDHLLDAYVYLPSTGYREEIDAFLKKFGARCFYDRARDGVLYRGEEEGRIARLLGERFALPAPAVEPMRVSTENALYRVFTHDAAYVLKLFKVSGNYHRTRVAEHTDYEARLVTQLKGRGIPTAGVVPASDGGEVTVEGFSALLFERIPGAVEQRPEYPLEAVGPALAAIHRVQLERPLDLPTGFSFDDTCMIWLPQFQNYLAERDHPADIAEAFRRLAPLAEPLYPGEQRAQLFARSPAVHCHGDVTPKNVIVGSDGVARFFDFNNAFFGARMADLMDGGFEFSLAEKYVHLADFRRFDAFVAAYEQGAPLSAEERADLPRWIALMGVIKFAKEVRVIRDPALKRQHSLRTKRALAIAGFLSERIGACRA
ncbi:phosphotransferase enzyme family protein [Endothiovibrio diazotrophicus]